MPTDPSINLSTSAAAAFCARLCVHPLDHFKASLHQSNQPLQQQELRPRLAHFLTAIRHHLHTLHLHSSPQQQQHKSHHHTTFREQLKLYRRLYHGAPLALIINVPALAFFLSTYDATKHFIAYLSSSSHLNLTHFQLHHFETHLISGLMAKVAGTILWAPQAKLSRMQGSHHGQLSLQEALQLLKKVAASEGSGVWSLWSGYRTTLNSLLPYTMLYFATYEKLKQFARLRIISREEQQLQDKTSSQTAITGAGREIDYRTDQRPLDLGTYMVCVAGAVAISATVCHTADALRVHIQDRWTTASSSTSVSTVLSAPRSATTSPMLPSSPVFRNSGSIMTPNSLATSTLVATTIPQQYHHHSHAHAHTPVTQHANMTTTTTTTPAHSPRRPLTTSGTGYQLQRRKQTSSGSGGLLRRIGRGLGPRVMWTAPGVTLTTAGFEVFRNLALGIM
ncbi:MAG: mitochondrial carrier domain-containing protein [Linnemannia elongata]|nr:MAG: mitochondrial carrier domain-containing protein [Linnemannia elongata]